ASHKNHYFPFYHLHRWDMRAEFLPQSNRLAAFVCADRALDEALSSDHPRAARDDGSHLAGQARSPGGGSLGEIIHRFMHSELDGIDNPQLHLFHVVERWLRVDKAFNHG